LRELRGNFNTIFFDFWNTLVHGIHSANPSYQVGDPLSWAEIWLTNASEIGVQVDPDKLLRAMERVDRIYYPRVYEFKGRMKEFWDLYNEELLNRLGIDCSSRDLLNAVNFAFLDAKKWLSVFPETHFVLSELKRKGYELGIISNNTDEIIDRMRSLDLTGYFSTITYSQEAGSEKPDPATFKLALSRTGKLPSECLHIGDSFEHDVVGAVNSGIQPILLDRQSHSPKLGIPIIHGLQEVLNHLTIRA
jgi:HAD superfamily hydrolase (TIGR01509 family)